MAKRPTIIPGNARPPVLSITSPTKTSHLDLTVTASGTVDNRPAGTKLFVKGELNGVNDCVEVNASGGWELHFNFPAGTDVSGKTLTVTLLKGSCTGDQLDSKSVTELRISAFGTDIDSSMMRSPESGDSERSRRRNNERPRLKRKFRAAGIVKIYDALLIESLIISNGIIVSSRTARLPEIAPNGKKRQWQITHSHDLSGRSEGESVIHNVTIVRFSSPPKIYSFAQTEIIDSNQ